MLSSSVVPEAQPTLASVPTPAPRATVRPARPGDLEVLVALEERCFAGDRLSRRSFRHLLARGHAITLLGECEGQVLGYVVVTLREGSQQARIYSIAVDPAAQGRGLGRLLLTAAERAAQDVGRTSCRLEVRVDNHAAIELYRSFGYRQVSVYPSYYEDGADGLRLLKAFERSRPDNVETRASTDSVLVLVDRLDEWRPEYPRVELMTAEDYLDSVVHTAALVVNLCRNQRYQSRGYYCSLLAEARGQRVLPSPQTSQDLRRPVGFSPRKGLDTRAQTFLDGLAEDTFALEVMFGQTRELALSGFARELFDAFPAPLLRVMLRRKDGAWQVQRVSAGSYRSLPDGERAVFVEQLHKYAARGPRPARRPRRHRYRLAVLVDPNDPTAPSNDAALRKFVAAGPTVGIECELITPRDASKLFEYDALFIRTTTSVDHFTYRLARRAELAGMVVIDDSQSILRCSNKIYQHELFRRHDVPTPASVAIARGQLERAEQICGYPVVIKAPDGSSSLAVHKADNREALERHARAMFQRSELLLAQEFTYTEFDWRVGVLDREPIFAAQYFMYGDHWQVIDCRVKSEDNYGPTRAVPLDRAPREVVETALRAANLIGDGFYGVDLKQTRDGRVVVIEVNDNPNVDSGNEDQLDGDRLFERIIGDFRRRLDLR